MASGDDLVRYITEQVVTYMDTPKEVRKQIKQIHKQEKEDWQVRWFGMVPLAIRMLTKQVRSKATSPKG
ncbi:YqzE family protein [Paenibacillus eucommiae]|uniref:Ubiquinone biosynthesis protein COQ9 n=1 Tax=Paenibacillus eucommiae TaxID=1355755 RepID=A0ABS4INM6_9BACL|nr:YqzE family protein [Paenibacillus eucommiae]MBP1989162.1 ubiquinone biosynthesis protein COQ9 [Paenibacillus eucommiae]